MIEHLEVPSREEVLSFFGRMDSSDSRRITADLHQRMHTEFHLTQKIRCRNSMLTFLEDKRMCEPHDFCQPL